LNVVKFPSNGCETFFMNETQYKVNFSDLDINKHVNNCVFLRWQSDAREDIWQRLNIQGNFVLLSSGCKFIKQVFYPDTITVKTYIDSITSTNVHCFQEIVVITNLV
jgi:acyl-CoA thioester hydrolase